MREGLINIDSLTAYTRDNVPVNVSGTLYYRVTDAYKSCFAVQNSSQAVGNLGTSASRAILGKFEYDEINSDRNVINSALVLSIQKNCEIWGIECTKFEIQDIQPENSEVKRQLELQVHAERSRRENDLNTTASIRTSEGLKEAAILKSEGELITSNNSADAKKYALDTETSARIKLLSDTVVALGGDYKAAVEYLVEMNRVEQLKEIAKGNNNSTYFLPTGLLNDAQKFLSSSSLLLEKSNYK
jgi:regulator of protease activity HflC (stomatin/prohibitin superfamily)